MKNFTMRGFLIWRYATVIVTSIIYPSHGYSTASMSCTQDTQPSSLSETYLRFFHKANTIELDDHKLLDSIGFLEQVTSKVKCYRNATM